MQDANLLFDPRGRAEIPHAIAPPMRASASLSSGLAQSEQQADTLENPDTQPNHEDAHTAWSAHMREHKSAETNIENSETIKSSSDIMADDIWRSISVVEMSDTLSDPRSEILSPHFQFAELDTPAQPVPAETQLLGPEGSFSELPITGLSLPTDMTASDTVTVNGPNLDITGQDTLSTLADTNADINIEVATLTQDPSDGPERLENRQYLLLANTDLKITLDHNGNHTDRLERAVSAIAADESVLGQTPTPLLDPAIAPQTQRLETSLDTNSLVQNVDIKTAAGYIKASENVIANIDPQTPISSTAPAELSRDTILVDAVEDFADLNLRTAQTDFPRVENVLEDIRFSDIVNHSTEDLAKDLYVKTSNATTAMGLTSGLAPSLTSITDPALALDTSQFLLGTTQSVTPSTHIAATLAVNSLAPIPITGSTIGPNTVAIVSDAMLMAKETAKGVTVQLDPPEMGRVYIDFIFEADRPVNIIVKTETLDAQHMLRERSDDFLALLKEEGLDDATLSFEFHDNQGFEGFDQSFVSEPLDSQLAADDHHQSPPIVQNSYSKTISYTDGLDLRL